MEVYKVFHEDNHIQFTLYLFPQIFTLTPTINQQRTLHNNFSEEKRISIKGVWLGAQFLDSREIDCLFSRPVWSTRSSKKFGTGKVCQTHDVGKNSWSSHLLCPKYLLGELEGLVQRKGSGLCPAAAAVSLKLISSSFPNALGWRAKTKTGEC